MRMFVFPLSLALAFSATFAVTQAWAGMEGARVSDGKSEVSLVEIRREISAAPKEVQGMILGNKDYVGRITRSLLVDGRVAEHARGAGYLARPEIQAQIARETRGILSRAYMADLLAQSTANMPDLSALAKERYNAEKAQYAIPATYLIAHILIAVDCEDQNQKEPEARAKAEKILAEVRAGGDFSALAKTHSEDQGTAAKGGELPWSSKGRFVPPFEKAAFALQPGEVSGLVRTRFGYHIIKMLERKEEGTRSFDEVKAQILDKLKTEYQNREREKLLSSLQGTKEVEITDDMMAYLRGQ